MFSSALFCVDLADDRDVCLKVLAISAVLFEFCVCIAAEIAVRKSETFFQVIKNSKDFFDQSLDEIKLLKLLQQHDPEDAKNVLRLYDFFYFKVMLPHQLASPRFPLTCNRLPFSRLCPVAFAY